MCLIDFILIRIYAKKVRLGHVQFKTYDSEFTYSHKFLLHVLRGKYNHTLE